MENINFQHVGEHAWLYEEKKDQYDLTIKIYQNQRNKTSWVCDIYLIDQVPSDLCKKPEECDYGDASLDDKGAMIVCSTCLEKDFLPMCSCFEDDQKSLVKTAKQELSKFHKYQKVEGIDHLLNKKWVFQSQGQD